MSSSVGVFREGEIDGKPFHIFTLLFQTDNPSSPSSSYSFSSFSYSSSSSSSFLLLRGLAAAWQALVRFFPWHRIKASGGDDDLCSSQPRFDCPKLRFKSEEFKRGDDYSNEDIFPFTTPAHFPNIRSVEQFFDPTVHSDICKFPLLPLCVEYYKCCSTCGMNDKGPVFYTCGTCRGNFHKECVEAPLEIKHPSYPFSSLRLYSLPRYFLMNCTSCGDSMRDLFYHCPIYDLNIHLFCAMKPIPIFIDHPKRHPHPLSFFPKQNFLPCNVCGLIHAFVPTYVCGRCVFVVHQDCIYFPSVIRICRHHHRISFTSSLPSGNLFCGVCRRKVDNDYGAYSCNKCDNFFVHSRCALRKDLWDGKELEGIPEEPEVVVEPFERIASGIILHFSHGHNLKLEISRVYDDDQFCQACALPIYDGSYYSCMDQCDFLLHEACANSPLQKIHPLHAHPLTLQVPSNKYQGGFASFMCRACQRRCCGFAYDDPTNDDFKLELRCAAVSEPFKFEGHEHPLFLALTQEEEKSAICQICKGKTPNWFTDIRKLNCIECSYIICFTCATLPYKARYKHDKHFLTLREWKEESDESCWCEVCETKLQISSTRAFYACDDYCCTTLHVDCLLGKDMYMKPGITIHMRYYEARILRNNTLSRPFCHHEYCDEDRCLYRLYFVKIGRRSDLVTKNDRTFCSYKCAWNA